MKKPLWQFIDNQGTFTSKLANQINTLYFPLANPSIMASVSPDLHGDIKTDFESFLLQPASRIDLSNLKSSRNFWIYINPQKIWSATGVSKDIKQIKQDEFRLEAGLLWQKITRQNKGIGLEAEITSFIPTSGEPVELMLVDISNISGKPIKFIPTCAIPIFGRSAHNLFDHRQVTSLLERIEKHKFGVIATPTLIFSESGHKKNFTSYFVLGIGQNNNAPLYIYPTQEEFTGENSDLEAPHRVFNNLAPIKKTNIQGKEAMGALRFKACLLKPKQSASYIILMGIVKNQKGINPIFKKFNTKTKVQKSLQETKIYWQKKSSEIKVITNDPLFDNWFKWVNIQPVLRKIFGCSFLPDFDYGKGGKGWRDLWQDSLALILNNPQEVKLSLINNFSGVRIDGSNATIIGQDSQEFIADRNNIIRVWMDHGIWPLITLHLYIQQTGDLKILLDETSYFRDHQLCRSREIDYRFSPDYGKELKTKTKKIYRGSVLEHLLVENLVPFFHVGPHNHILLENADWNDGLDMASKFGESVALSSLYAQNLRNLAEIIERLEQKNVFILKELAILLDSISPNKIDYSSISAKHRLLDKYFQSTKYEVSGKKIPIPKAKLISDLKKKADWIYRHIQNKEWLKEGFFNGYYNNAKQRVEGNIGGLIRMTLTGQTFPVMSGIATGKQIKILFKSVEKYLQDKQSGGFHLNTDFSRSSFKISGGIPPKAGKEEQLNLGRAFSFVYGDKENGAFFNHMTVMFAYALYKQGFAHEGYEVLNSIYRMALDTQKSKIYPCLPEYFNAEGRGMYSYLTGSASWFMLTLLTQGFGIRGEYGDFIIEPKLVAEQFKNKKAIAIVSRFADKQIEIKFVNPAKKNFGRYLISKVNFNGKIIAENIKTPRFNLSRNRFLSLCNNNINTIEIILA